MIARLQDVPTPPLPPGSEMSVTESLEGVTVVVLLLGLSLIVSALLWPLIKAIATRIGGGSVSAALETEVEALRERVRQLEEMPPRMAELEERVDFTERLLSRGQDVTSAATRHDQA
jgi:hypothetical protein